MPPRAVQLSYAWVDGPRNGAALAHPLFELLAAVHQQGSIQKAATALGLSYRHVWGALKQWEAELAEPLLTWSRGQPATLTPIAERLLWSEALVRARRAPQLAQLQQDLAEVLPQVLEHAPQGGPPPLRVAACADGVVRRLRRHLSVHTRLRCLVQPQGSADALRALAEGRVDLAVVASPGRTPPGVPPALAGDGGAQAWPLGERPLGWLLPAGNPQGISTLAEGLQRRWCGREPGSATAAWVGAAATQHPGALPPAATEPTPAAVAVQVAAGWVEAGLAPADWAAPWGLHFQPLHTETLWLVARPPLWSSVAWRALPGALRTLPGAPQGAGLQTCPTTPG